MKTFSTMDNASGGVFFKLSDVTRDALVAWEQQPNVRAQEMSLAQKVNYLLRFALQRQAQIEEQAGDLSDLVHGVHQRVTQALGEPADRRALVKQEAVMEQPRKRKGVR